MRTNRHLLPLLILPLLCSCHEEQNIAVEVDVSVVIPDENHTSPLTIRLINNTRNADSYLWTFERGEPPSSNLRVPDDVTFVSPGEHSVTLRAWNPGDEAEKTWKVRVDSSVVADFATEAEVNNYSPAVFHVSNLSSGGTDYRWSFPGGYPEAYSGHSPPPVLYNRQGIYTMTLTVSNGSSTFTTAKDIEVRESLDASFSILPSFEDADDMEAPLRATFNTKLQGTVSVRWSSSGGTITTPDSVNASILFPAEGEYEVALTASNGKDSLRVTQNITVRKNTNLRTHENIRLGINTARDSLPVCYSTKLRKAFRLDEVTDSIAPLIDIVYMGMNKSFTYNAFVSPDMLSRTPFPEIKGARHTYFVNRIEESPLSLSASQFRAMDNDALLRNKLIRQGEQEEMYFGNAVPRVVLFETYDGRKGAILVKETVSLENNDSYTVVDIKVQKND